MLVFDVRVRVHGTYATISKHILVEKLNGMNVEASWLPFQRHTLTANTENHTHVIIWFDHKRSSFLYVPAFHALPTPSPGLFVIFLFKPHTTFQKRAIKSAQYGVRELK